MKRLLIAAAAAPFLLACSTAGAAAPHAASAEPVAAERVLIVNGKRIALEDGEDAGAAIERSVRLMGEGPDGETAFDFDLDLDFEGQWDAGSRREFEAAVEALTAELAEMNIDLKIDNALDEGKLRVEIERIEARAEAYAEDMEAYGEEMRRQGLSMGISGIEAGLAGIDKGLERGWVIEDGERRRVAFPRHHPGVLVLDLATSLRELPDEHLDRLQQPIDQSLGVILASDRKAVPVKPSRFEHKFRIDFLLLDAVGNGDLRIDRVVGVRVPQGNGYYVVGVVAIFVILKVVEPSFFDVVLDLPALQVVAPDALDV